jgi:ribosome recycling factor
MYRSPRLAAGLGRCARTTPFLARAGFTTTPTAFKKKGHRGPHGGENDPQPVSEISPLDFSALEAKYKKTLATFSEKLKELRAGKANIEKFLDLEVTLQHGEAHVLKDIATTQLRGNRVSIVVYDPKHVKYVQSAILADMNLTPQLDSKNNQTIHVRIGEDDQDSKSEAAKSIKQLYEHFRNSASKHSLTQIRADGLAHLKRSHKAKDLDDDTFRRLAQNVEKSFKEYNDKLNETLKRAQI